MLTSFPTPYEDEWWYSVLCRHYLTTGIRSSAVAKKMIFGNESAHMGTVFPNGTVYAVVKQLPENLYDIREILLNHTTLKFFIRLYPRDEQEYIIKYLSEGGAYQMTHLWKNYKRQDWKPRYCPICVREDPEPYYHLSHQIPMVRCCVKHGCRLKMVNLEHAERELNTKFYPLGIMKLDERVEMATEADMVISRLAVEHQELPLSYGPTPYSNLKTGLFNAGYRKIHKAQGECVDEDKLYADMVRLYGAETVRNAFGDKIARGVFNYLRCFKTYLPDRYILMQGLIGMSTKEMLGPEIQDNLKMKLLEMSGRSQMQSLKLVARELGVVNWRARAMCKYYGIEPFWMEKGKGKSKEKKTGKLVIMVDERELEEMKDMAKRMGFRNVGDFCLNCVRFCRKDGRMEADLI